MTESPGFFCTSHSNGRVGNGDLIISPKGDANGTVRIRKKVREGRKEGNTHLWNLPTVIFKNVPCPVDITSHSPPGEPTLHSSASDGGK